MHQLSHDADTELLQLITAQQREFKELDAQVKAAEAKLRELRTQAREARKKLESLLEETIADRPLFQPRPAVVPVAAVPAPLQAIPASTPGSPSASPPPAAPEEPARCPDCGGFLHLPTPKRKPHSKKACHLVRADGKARAMRQTPEEVRAKRQAPPEIRPETAQVVTHDPIFLLPGRPSAALYKPEELGITASFEELYAISSAGSLGRGKLEGVAHVSNYPYAVTGAMFTAGYREVALTPLCPASLWTGPKYSVEEWTREGGYYGLLASHHDTSYVLGHRDQIVTVFFGTPHPQEDEEETFEILPDGGKPPRAAIEPDPEWPLEQESEADAQAEGWRATPTTDLAIPKPLARALIRHRLDNAGQVADWAATVEDKDYGKTVELWTKSHGKDFLHVINEALDGARQSVTPDQSEAEGDMIDPPCRVCGCTELNACPGGCHWVEDDLCSACHEKLQDEAKKPPVFEDLGIKVGDLVRTSYGTGPYRVHSIHEGRLLDCNQCTRQHTVPDDEPPVYSMILGEPDSKRPGKNPSFLNQFRRESGRILRVYSPCVWEQLKDTRERDEVFIVEQAATHNEEPKVHDPAEAKTALSMFLVLAGNDDDKEATLRFVCSIFAGDLLTAATLARHRIGWQVYNLACDDALIIAESADGKALKLAEKREWLPMAIPFERKSPFTFNGADDKIPAECPAGKPRIYKLTYHGPGGDRTLNFYKALTPKAAIDLAQRDYPNYQRWRMDASPADEAAPARLQKKKADTRKAVAQAFVDDDRKAMTKIETTKPEPEARP